MDSLFGEGTSLPVRFFVAFVVVFALIGLTAWLIRRFGTGSLGTQKARGRAPRLAVIEAGAVDGRRKLVLIRRDNVEHLIMIGGPTDILVEANIVRGQSSRERASSVADNLTRVLAGATGEEPNWPPLQPEPAPRSTPTPRPAPLEDSSQWALQPEQSPPPAPPKRPRSLDPLAGLAAELSARPPEPAAHAQRPAPMMETPRVEAPRVELPRMAPKSAPMPAPMSAPMPAPASAPAPAASQQSADQNLADMAQRLEAALRRPAAPATSAPRPAAPAPAPKPAAEAPRVAPPAAPPASPAAAPASAPEVTAPAAAAPEKPKEAPAPVAAKPAPAPSKAAPEKSDKPDDVFGSLEEEMASLLGRPAGKPS
jgi:flagellar biogenesis protein FliO